MLLTALGTAVAMDPIGHGGAASVPGTGGDTCLRSGQSPARVPAGTVMLGEDGSREPGRTVQVEQFWIDRTEVTNRQFDAFVKATGYVTIAEREGSAAVFRVPDALPRGLDDPTQWWSFVEGADWRHPFGPSSSLRGKENEPVVQLGYKDVERYAAWAGGRLPSQAEWERAARGNQVSPRSPTAWAYGAKQQPLANTWQGVFPIRDMATDGHRGIAPVGCYAPNDFGLYDMVGNVWEWTKSKNAEDRTGVVKGGSFLCAMNYCANFRPAAWQAQEKDLPTAHIGFRLVYDDPRH